MNVSETVRRGRHVSCCGTYAESFLYVEVLMGEKLRRRVPWVGDVLAARISRRVDFPAPLGPTMARIWEGKAVSETSRRMKVVGTLLHGLKKRAVFDLL